MSRGEMRDKTMNRLQLRYLAAKAMEDCIEEEQNSREAEFIRKNQIMEAGELVGHLWHISDRAYFEEVLDEYAVFLGPDDELGKEAGAARAARVDAEDALLAWSLSIIPTSLAAELRHGMMTWKFREELVETALKIDVSTLPRHMRGTNL